MRTVVISGTGAVVRRVGGSGTMFGLQIGKHMKNTPHFAYVPPQRKNSGKHMNTAIGNSR